MTSPHLTLESVAYSLPTGRTLFSGLNETFDHQPTALIGRNGVGKTVLARLLCGQLLPTRGRCLRAGTVHYLEQQSQDLPNATVASLAGIAPRLHALMRIEAGSAHPTDFDLVGDQWDLQERFQHTLQHHGLGHLDANTPAQTLSGGERIRISLIRALLSEVDFLILDEPTNHLDEPSRHALLEQLQRWPSGLLVISHDRQLLDTMQRIVKLSSLGLRSYGGNYTAYSLQKTQAQHSAIQQLEHHKREREREKQAIREQRQRQEHRQARGKRQGKTANQAKILLGRRKDHSEGAAGKLRQQHDVVQAQLAERVREAARQVERDTPITLHALPVTRHLQQRVAELTAVALPFVSTATRHIDLTLTGHQRLGVVGPNGCGKSTLLRVLAGQLAPLAGRCQVTHRRAYLDQALANLDPDRSALAVLQAANQLISEAALRMRLAHLGLDAQKTLAPSGSLSGGERVKAALACVLYAEPPPQLLLLDEPSNHLDLPSLEALETMLRSYSGTLIVVSHDAAFLDALALTHRLSAGDQGWQLMPWK